MMTAQRIALVVMAFIPAVAGADKPEAPLTLPASLKGKAEVVAPADPDYARADAAGAIKPAGEGGISQALVVRLTADVPIWRMWNGPTKKDARGNTNRMGQWWSYDAPRGPVDNYRKAYEICVAWNDLVWMAQCTLKKGAVVAIGPGQSVSAKTCGDSTDKETYAENPKDWQVWISKSWTRSGPGKEMACEETFDYEVSQADIGKSKTGTKAQTIKDAPK